MISSHYEKQKHIKFCFSHLINQCSLGMLNYRTNSAIFYECTLIQYKSKHLIAYSIILYYSLMKLRNNMQNFGKNKLEISSQITSFNSQSCLNQSKLQQQDGLNLKQFIVNQNKLNELFKSFLEHSLVANLMNSASKASQNHRETHSILTISNHSTKQQMKHGKQFKEMLDPRDRILEHDFDFRVTIDLEDIKQRGFLNSQTYKSIVDNTHQFMVQTLANILSVSFKFLNDDQLEVKQVKNYAAANIMLNLQSLFSQIIDTLGNSEILRELALNYGQIKVDLVEKMETIMKNILINQAAYYPQAPITGGTMRMNSIIHKVNRVDDQENDLIYINGIKISQYVKMEEKDGKEQLHLRQDQDYCEFIMQVINAAIRVVQTCQGDSQQRVNKQIFTQFNKQLFALSQNQSFKGLFQIIEHHSNYFEMNETNQATKQRSQKTISYTAIGIEKQSSKELQTNLKEPIQILKDNIEVAKLAVSSYFERITQTKAQQLRNIQKEIQNNELCRQINKQRQKNLENLKDYGIGFKIPNYVKPFSKQQMAEKQFRAKHSSVLRILTKWAEYLQYIFINAQKYIMKRRYPFKDINHNLINITDESVKKQIIQNLNKEYVEVNRKLEKIKDTNIELVSQIISKGKGPLPHNVYRFTQTREVSSKINAVLTSLMVEYLSVLIHHLLKAGKNITRPVDSHNRKFLGNINLLVFKVSDLMRAKFKCSESSFIALLKTMHLLDESKAMKGKFKLVRIKNKLQESANNIMINYLFMGKILCQLQLSIQESKGKEKNYYTFSHFIYELTRGNFGVISQCAIMVSQLDPIASFCEELYYQQKNQKFKKKKEKDENDENSQEKYKKEENIFYCVSCERLIIKQRLQLFYKKQVANKCTKCFFAQQYIEKKINEQFFPYKKLILGWLEEDKLKRIRNYGEMFHKNNFFLRVSPTGKMEFGIVVYVENERKHILLKISLESLRKQKKEQAFIEFVQGLNFVSIEKLIKGKKPITDHFLFLIDSKQTLKQFLNEIQSSLQILERQVKKMTDAFYRFRLEKKMIKSIKSKAEIMYFTHGKEQWQFFQKLWQVYSIEDNAKRQQQINKEIKYRKYKQLQFNKIKVIEANNDTVQHSNNDWIPRCPNLEELKLVRNYNLRNIDFLSFLTSIKVLNLSFNSISNINGLKNITNINTLNLSNNCLQNVDALDNITTIEQLNLSRNKLLNIDGLKNITTIHKLSLEHNSLKNVDSLQLVTTAHTLSLEQNQLQTIDGLRNLRTAHALYLQNNRIVSIDALKTLTTIYILRLQQNSIENVDSLSNVTTIHTLNLSSNKLENVAGLRNMTSVTILNVSKNKLESIGFLKHTKGIQTLQASHNFISDIDVLKHITSINTLNLSSNLLSNIKALSNITTIQNLMLQQNRITNIDPLRNITHIQTLQLQNNQIAHIEGLRNLANINHLNLAYNLLENVDALSRIKSVQYLNLSSNKLKNIDGIRNIASMTKLLLHSNTNLEVGYLPPTLISLQADFHQLAKFDFAPLTKLQELRAQNDKHQLYKNLRLGAKLWSF